MLKCKAKSKPLSILLTQLYLWLGEAAVGKSSLVIRFVNRDFQENREPTIGGKH